MNGEKMFALKVESRLKNSSDVLDSEDWNRVIVLVIWRLEEK